MNFLGKRNRHLTISIFAGFIIIIAVERPLFNNALKGKEKDFNDKVFFVVGSLEEQILRDTMLMQKISSNAVMVSLLQTSLKSKIDSVFLKNGIPINYVLAAGKIQKEIENLSNIGQVLNSWRKGDLIWSGDPKNDKDIIETRLKIAFLGAHPNKVYFIKIFFPSKKQFLLSQLLPELIAMGLTLVILFVCFQLLLSIIRKQNQIALVKNDFISNMTHEFKTPLFTISVATKLLAQQDSVKSNSKHLSYLKTIQEEVARLLSLADKVLETSASEEKVTGELRTEEDVHSMLQNASSRLELLRSEYGAAIEMKLNAVRHHITGNKANLETVFVNIIDNAIKYSGDAARILIETENDKNNIIISISDNGIGFDPSLKELVFERFFRAHSGNIHNVKGYGIGLSFARSVVEAHDGNIRVNTVLGQGSKFTVLLPPINYGNE